MYNVFTDFHHAGLLQSFIILFEKRLGGNVYRPIGIEWAEQGFWKVYDHPATQLQYLGIGGATPDGTPPLNTIIEADNKIYRCQDIDSGDHNKAITLATFYQLPIDIVIASLPQHIEPYARLCQLHHNKPKLIYQIGNAWDIPQNSSVRNVMASAIVPNVPENIHYISYHQEFDTDIFRPQFVEEYGWPLQTVYSFINCFHVAGHFSNDWQLFIDIESLMTSKGWNFKAYGGQCRDGAAHGTKELAQKMNEARFIWHTKNFGDGYGHVIHNAAAMGKPLIVKKEYYVGKMAEALLKDGETCICIDGLNPQQIVEKIEYYNDPERYQRLCQNTYANFKRVVNFDEEAVAIKHFLRNLQ